MASECLVGRARWADPTVALGEEEQSRMSQDPVGLWGSCVGTVPAQAEGVDAWPVVGSLCLGCAGKGRASCPPARRARAVSIPTHREAAPLPPGWWGRAGLEATRQAGSGVGGL